MHYGRYTQLNSRPFLYTVTVPPEGQIVTLEQVKQQLNIAVTDTTDDVLLALYIASVTEFIENFTKRDYLVRTYETFRDFFGNGHIAFPSIYGEYYTEDNFQLQRSPVLAVTKVDYLVDGSFTLLDNSLFYVAFDQARYAKILLRPEQTYPTDKDDILQSIKITFTAGLTPVPANIQLVATQLVTSLYADRGDCSCDTMTSYLQGASKALLNQERILQL